MEPKSFYKIRFSDCDSFKHLHNSGYIDYMLNAREDHLKEFYSINMDELYKRGSSWMVNRHEIIYLNPAAYNAYVCITSNLIMLTADSLLVEMAMWNAEEKTLKALLWTKFIHINMQTGKRDKHPSWFMEIASALVNTSFGYTNQTERLTALLE